MKKKISSVLIVMVIAFVIGGAYLTFCVFSGGKHMYEANINVVTNERTSDEVLTNWLVNDKGFDMEAFMQTYQVKEITIDSSLGDHKIPASYIYAKGNTDETGDTVIMIHGLLGNRLSNYPMAQLFLSNGYNVITYDQRNSGGNTAQQATYGYFESYDAMDYIRYAKSLMAPESKLGIWGQSMGAATVENAMDEPDYASMVDFAVLDSPLGNMEDMVGRRDFMSSMKKKYASFLSDKNLGFSYEDQYVYSQICNTDVPVLCVSSKADSRIPFDLQVELYNTIAEENKQLYVVTDSDHSDIFFDYPEEYQQQLNDFLDKYCN